MADIEKIPNPVENDEKIYVEGFGKQLVHLYKLEGTSKIFIAEFTDNDITYEAVVNNKGQTLLPFSTSGIQDYFNSKDYKDYCFVLYDDTNHYRSYHFKEINKEFVLAGASLSTNDTLCRFLESEKGYWVVERAHNGITEYCLYDVENAQIITPFFDEIKFEEENDPRILALFEKNIYYNPEEYGNSILLDRIDGFIDYKGNFISPFYSEEQGEFYESLCYNHDKYFKGFYTIIENITYKLSKKYEEKSARIEDNINNLFDSLYHESEVNKINEPAKIIQFDRRKK